MVNGYNIIELPIEFINKTFRNFSKTEASEYLEWSKSIQNERIAYLENIVKCTYPEWNADFSKESLVVLYNWFEQNVSFRVKTASEYKDELNQLESTPLLKDVIAVSDPTLDDKTVSICFDTGILFAKCISCKLGGTYWKYVEKPKSDIFYHQPVLTSENAKVDLNPRNIMEVCARKTLENLQNKQTFIQLYDVWVKMLA